MFYIEAQKELAAKSEFVDGQVFVLPNTLPTTTTTTTTTSPSRGGVAKARGRGRGRKKK